MFDFASSKVVMGVACLMLLGSVAGIYSGMKEMRTTQELQAATIKVADLIRKMNATTSVRNFTLELGKDGMSQTILGEPWSLKIYDGMITGMCGKFVYSCQIPSIEMGNETFVQVKAWALFERVGGGLTITEYR